MKLRDELIRMHPRFYLTGVGSKNINRTPLITATNKIIPKHRGLQSGTS